MAARKASQENKTTPCARPTAMAQVDGSSEPCSSEVLQSGRADRSKLGSRTETPISVPSLEEAQWEAKAIKKAGPALLAQRSQIR